MVLEVLVEVLVFYLIEKELKIVQLENIILKD
ncbi:MAG: hypothetical protein CM15mP51_05940 [Porticoccaceae bacterium]|nr:MAG: hypothetical protein CM15mP51_05940 [Porticoccaceae bacterium]